MPLPGTFTVLALMLILYLITKVLISFVIAFIFIKILERKTGKKRDFGFFILCTIVVYYLINLIFKVLG
ncbi:hypothetical protein A3A76_04750 [Candidatus Woesebacteria bacterium RIFCSPLOWO2_01_FULL_39_23]|uniref:Uncharacterized protein n=1 Tax=Candidatus Woesebacteria bacterium RIFCSPHIGHO2_01_FULL_40_22 TaxID=1802499 RepID=A0A1F7YKC0_9BACT|nr:MAG: hypothetical protein A2141_03975 [Candidatus Woesebacteria bacterium RBG_16_40_11]OGM27743.1 MAG: hypothetical protein A2628_04970 [Candidatus Woesebacteria bacterium RIFCSPHIGHO2_01_FULL_40_22]OGM36009.1 MAG: hypothetical protein A3E41_01225 [Candidatus Woesebacteria bacterium RIFCSPHIGHO2_12_FULL_38_9]OGM62165.1 MAG: hypothetical protein A3A76_04750 [Candidatus Woesebacteria bacterium RIFCSPLOWO2_01_FULL_39_23]